MLDTLFIEDFIDSMEEYFHFWKFSSTDKRSETVSLIRNRKIYFIGRNKCIIKKIECWPFFKQDPKCAIEPFVVTSVLFLLICSVKYH